MSAPGAAAERTGLVEASPARPAPTPGTLFFSFLRLGAVSFGGPAMVAYIRRLAVEQRSWVSKEEFQHGVALCQAVPGATAMQCAAWVGLRVSGLRGAVATYVGFGLPSFALMLALSAVYRHTADLRLVAAALTGLRALVVALVANAAWQFARASVKTGREGALALVAAVLFLTGGSPFLIVAAAGLAGIVLLRKQGSVVSPSLPVPSPWMALRPPALVLIAAVVVVAAAFAAGGRPGALALVMMRVDAFAFGGGFASIPLMLSEVVGRGWLPARAFMDGIALGQVTPGPIVITSTFVGYQVAGLTGAVAATLGIFLPSLFMVVLIEPWFERLRSSSFFQAVTRGLVLSFVGLLVSVTIQFARVAPWNGRSIVLAVVALVALLRDIEVAWVVIGGAIVSAFFW